MLRRTLIGLGALLVGYHAWLFGSQLWGGELADLALVVRWLLALGLLGGLLGLRRQGASMFWGRKAVALWLLATLLHGPALIERFGAGDASSAQGVSATLVQVAASTVVFASLVLLVALVLGSRRARKVPFPVAGAAVAAGRPTDVSRLLLAPRPPPAAV